ncbi:MAG: aspartate--tRNA(Asn) ligase [Deltaproteobacteria bacterium]|nr:aspartate--tRNA(Asn) ligase [Deltaproteobacteria bacterium]
MFEKRVLIKDAGHSTGKIVELAGWVHNLRVLSKFSFLILRDRSGTVQCVVDASLFDTRKLNLEDLVILKGKVAEDKRSKIGYEIQTTHIEIVSKAHEQLPILVNKPLQNLNLNLDTILDHRTLSIRQEEISSIFKIQNKLIQSFREYLLKNDFTEIYTPKIVATGTEGGSELFQVKYFERKAYLAQSPQFYKQHMVGAGYERVFETAHVYRAEQHNTSRHLNEYYSLDFEMGFINDETDIMRFEMGLLSYMFSKVREECHKELSLFKYVLPEFKEIPIISLEEACKILLKKFKKDVHGDLDPDSEKLLCEYFDKENGMPLVFVNDYPQSKRPMYAMPHKTKKGLTHSFDLIFNGLEITTGGQRIHNYDMLVQSIASRGLDPESFKDYLEIFKFGMPPHGGLAIGAERITMKVLNLTNIREACFYPRDRIRITP